MDIDPFDLNLRHLAAAAAMAARGSMAAASAAVGISQPALTQGLAKLERQLGVHLFERQPDGMAATPAGATIARRTRAALDHLARAVRASPRAFASPENIMTATQLRAFLAVADAVSFAGAARASGASQPALHRAVRELEQVCGLPLVERRGRSVGITPAGHRLARGARLARAEFAAAIEEANPRDEGGGRIIVGAMPLSRAFVLPYAIAAFAKASPGAHVEVIEGSWRELVDPLRDGILDLMIGALRDVPPENVVQEPLLVDRLSIIGRAGHPLAGSQPATGEALAGFPWIVGQTGTPLRAQWEKLFDGSTLPNAPVECGSVMVIREVLRHSDFLALVSPDQVALELKAGVLASVGPSLAHSTRTIGISHRADWHPTPAQGRFLNLLRDAASAPGISEI